MGFGVRNGAINALPVLGNDAVCSVTDQANGFTSEIGFNNPEEAGTILPWYPNALPPMPNERFHLWSSYRYVNEDVYTETKEISFYASLRALTGTSVTMSRTPHPSKLIPS